MPDQTLRLKAKFTDTGDSERLNSSAAEDYHFYPSFKLRWETFVESDDATAHDVTQYTSLALRLSTDQRSRGTTLMTKTATPVACSPSAWASGAEQHAVFEFTATETNIDMQFKSSRRVWWLLVGITGTTETPLASGWITAQGKGSSGTPTANPSLYATVDALNAVAAASGDVDGPSSSTNNALARFDGTTGKLLKNSSATLSNSGELKATTLTATTVGAMRGSADEIGATLSSNDNGSLGFTDGVETVALKPSLITASQNLFLPDETGTLATKEHVSAGYLKKSVSTEFSLSGDVLSLAYPAGQIPTSGLADSTLLSAAMAASQVTRVLAPSADPTTDRRAEIQALWDYFAPAGGVIVELYPSAVYRVTTVNSPATGSKAAGAYGLEVPTNCGLRGQGPSTVIEIHAGGSFGTGCGISPYGMRDATTAYGAASNVTLQDFAIRASGQAASSGNLINLVDASNWLIEGVHIGSSYYHGTEIDRCRHLTFRRCRWDGSHTYASSGNHVQFDAGDAGPRSLVPTGALIEDVLFENCYFAQRTGGSVRDIELAHNTTPELRRITFRNCEMHGKNAAYTYIADIGSGIALTGGFCEEILFEGCTFHTYHAQAYAFYLIQNSGCRFDGIRFRNNQFRCRGFVMWCGGATGSSTALQTDYRREFEFRRNRVELIKPDFPNSTVDFYGVIVNQWQRALIRDNTFCGQGDYPGSYAAGNHVLCRAGNNWLVNMSDNHLDWSGNNAGGGGSRQAFTVLNDALDQQAIPTRSVIVRNNSAVTTGTANWSTGVYVVRHSALPAGSVYKADGNWSNVATTAPNQVLLSGATPV